VGLLRFHLSRRVNCFHHMQMKSLALVLAMAVPTAAFGVGPRAAPYPCRSSRTTTATMKKWDRRKVRP
jgi:hypothetical protein